MSDLTVTVPVNEQSVVLFIGDGSTVRLDDAADVVGTSAFTKVQRAVWAARLHGFANEIEATS